MLNRIGTFIAVSAAVIATAANQQPTLADDEVSVDDVRKAWAKRQKNFGTVEIQLKRKASGQNLRGLRKGTDYTFEQRIEIRFDDEKLDMQIRTTAALNITPLDFERYSYDGKTSYKFTNWAMNDTATVSGRKHHYGTNYAHFHPIAVTYRPLVSTISGFDFNDVRPDLKKKNAIVIDGKPCRKLAFRRRDGLTRMYYVDPTADFMPRRIESLTASGRRVTRCNISLKHDKKLGWIPTEWKRDPGSKSASHLIVKTIEINKKMPKDQFKMVISTFNRNTTVLRLLPPEFDSRVVAGDVR